MDSAGVWEMGVAVSYVLYDLFLCANINSSCSERKHILNLFGISVLSGSTKPCVIK